MISRYHTLRPLVIRRDDGRLRGDSLGGKDTDARTTCQDVHRRAARMRDWLRRSACPFVPGLSDFRIKSQQQVQMVIHDREATDGHGKNTRELLEPVLQPLFAVVVSCTQQERTANTARYAVIPAGKRDIDQLGSSDRHRLSLGRYIAVLHAMPVAASRSISPYVVDTHHRNRLSRPTSALQCVSFIPDIRFAMPVFYPLSFIPDIGFAVRVFYPVGVQWAWPGWIPRRRVCGVGGFEGTGKTRFALDLARRGYHGLPWPDGQPITLPPGSKSLWICGDGHQEEIAGAARKMNLPLNAVLFNASPEDACTGVDLDDPAAIESLDAFLEVSAAPLVFIDTLTNSTSRDLCRQNDVKLLLSPLQEIAQRRQVAIALLLHLSRDGQALGRRTKGLTRTLIHLDCRDPGQPTRLRLWVEKSFDARPPALGVTISEAGNEYDDGPPVNAGREACAPRKRGKAPVKLDACHEWLARQLSTQAASIQEVRAVAARAGFVPATLYNAATRLGVVEYVIGGRKCWRLPDPSLVSAV
jgi:AAA domain